MNICIYISIDLVISKNLKIYFLNYLLFSKGETKSKREREKETERDNRSSVVARSSEPSLSLHIVSRNPPT